MYIGLSVEYRPIVQSVAQLNQISVGDFMEESERPPRSFIIILTH
jgi:hypothetical protein